MNRHLRTSPRRLLAVGLAVCAFATACSAAGSPSVDATAIRGRGYKVVKTFPHDEEAFTQGLAFHRGRFYEGTGIEGRSSLRRVALRTGVVKKRIDLSDEYFGEGVTLIGDEIFQITWQNETAFVYDVETFELLQTFDYNTDDQSTQEGWGLADDGEVLAMSDGTDVIRFRDPETFAVIREVLVTDRGTPVPYLNELEWIGDEIFANVLGSDVVARIDPLTGNVTGRLNLAALREHETATCPHDPEVTNGIAYLQSKKRFFVTGKEWCHLFELELSDPPA